MIAFSIQPLRDAFQAIEGAAYRMRMPELSTVFWCTLGAIFAILLAMWLRARRG